MVLCCSHMFSLSLLSHLGYMFDRFRVLSCFCFIEFECVFLELPCITKAAHTDWSMYGDILESDQCFLLIAFAFLMWIFQLCCFLLSPRLWVLFHPLIPWFHFFFCLFLSTSSSSFISFFFFLSPTTLILVFLAALSSSWSLVARPSVRRSFGRSVRLPLWKSDL